MLPLEFANKLHAILGDKLISVVLYGSAARADFSKKYSDYNILCMLTEVHPAQLMTINKLIRQWTKAGNSLPLFFDSEHIRTSLDVFPMEFLDITACHKVLYGSDIFSDIHVDQKNLRHQCEMEIKGKLIYLRSEFSLISNQPKKVGELMVKTLSTFITLFKGVLRLLNIEPGESAKVIVEQLNAHIEIKPNCFFELIDIRNNNTILPRGDEAICLFENYISQIQHIAVIVDKMDV